MRPAQAIKLLEVVEEYRRVAPALSDSAASVVIGATASLIALQLVLCLARLPTVWRGIRSVTRPA